jgi:hypothetical protein
MITSVSGGSTFMTQIDLLYLPFGFIIKKEYFRGWLYILTNGLGLLENY